jgi:hypothetical protein
MEAFSATNATGRRISLLNDGPAPPQLVRLPSITPSLQSKSPSYASSPAGSPPTPALVRSNSSDSTMQTPSPITPDFAFDGLSAGLESPVFSQSGFFPPQHQHKDMNASAVYPPVPHTMGALPYHPSQAQPGYYRQAPQIPEAAAAAAAAANAANARPKKNSYPCPMARQYNCNDYFTTSGHAARHAKKHTGKKDAFCPECNKAFTRKDNMEQHRRTHQSGRNASKTATDSKKVTKQQVKRPKPAPLQSSMTSVPSLSSLNMVDPALPASPPGSYIAPIPQQDTFLDFTSQRATYPDPTAFSMAPGYTPGASYGGLDALAIAASGEKRKFES